jgi:predicted nucleic acid-binding protein
VEMNHIMLDTNAYIAVAAGNADARAIVDRAWTVSISSVVIGELLAGFAVGTRFDENRKALASFVSARRIEIAVITARTAEAYGKVYQTLRVIGRPIPQNDMWIAASAVEHGCGLFTYDRHFANVHGLQIGASVAELGVDPTTP